MIRLSRFVLDSMRQRTCITLHHAMQLCIRVGGRASSIPSTRRYVFAAYLVRDYGYHADDWIKCISHARIEHILVYAATRSVSPSTPARPHVGRILWDEIERRGRDPPRSLRPEQPRVRAIVSQGHGCKVCIYSSALPVSQSRRLQACSTTPLLTSGVYQRWK